MGDLDGSDIPGAENNPYAFNGLEGCDLLMIIKMQGAGINTNNTSAYGDVIDYNNVGVYEIIEVGTILGNTISLSNGCVLQNAYNISSTERVQVVRIPRLTSMTITAGASLVGRPWGQVPGTGGIVAIETSGNIVINGSITVQGQGYRGALTATASVNPAVTDYVSAFSAAGGQKGEGIAGNASDYDILGGRYSRGAPANGGGGGNSENAGGGGGSNAGLLSGYTGFGVPDNSNLSWPACWNQEAVNFAASSSPGGGRGGYSRSINNGNASTQGPGNIAWGGDNRQNIGGLGGRPLNYFFNTRLFMGGGGGSGHNDNGNSNPGANGGGIVYLISDGSVSGNGIINANGSNALGTNSPHTDAPGGGGGGGAVYVLSKQGITGITIRANGGNGGDQIISTNEAQGPGGGGGGGYILTSATSVLRTVDGGANGNTTSAALTEFPPNGATRGATGTIVNNVPYTPVTAPVNLGINIVGSPPPNCLNGPKSYTITVNNLSCNTATNLVIFLPPPSGLTFTSSSVGTGTYTAPHWSVSSLNPNSTAVLVVNGTITNSNVGVFSATVTSDNPECYVVNNSTTAPTFTVIQVNITAVAIPTAICQGSVGTVVASGATTYTWFPGNVTGSSMTVSPSSTTIYTVVGNVTTCIGSQTVQVNVNPNPTLVATAAPSLICPGGTGTLNASGATTYTWFPGFMTGPTHTVTSSVPVQYTVVGTDNNGCMGMAVVLLPVFVPTISAFPAIICIGNSSTLTAFGGVSYTWQPGSIISPTIAVSPTVSTTYTVSGTHATGCIATTVVGVAVVPIPTVNAVASPTRICEGGSSLLLANGAMTYYWLPPLNSSNNPIAVSPSVTTTYTVIGYTVDGCADTATVTVVVDPLPNIFAIPNPSAICRGSTSTLTAFGANTYTWFPPGNHTGSVMVVSPTVTTTYTVVGTNTFGCSNIAYVTVYVGPNITATAIPGVICYGQSSSLMAGGAVSYTWQPGGMNGGTVVVTPTISQSYTVTAIDWIGCIDSATVYVQVNPNPTLQVQATPSVMCAGDQVTVTASGAVNYVWYPGNTTGSIVTTFLNSTTIYTVTGTNQFGCTDTKTIQITVNNCTVQVPIGLAKKASSVESAGNDEYYVTFKFVVKNYATYPLFNIQIFDDLNNTFPAPSSYVVIPPPVSSTGSLVVNPFYSGAAPNNHLLAVNINSLLPGQADTIRVKVKFKPEGITTFTNTSWAYAQTLPNGGYSGTDVSTDGNNPDPNGDGNPSGAGENIPTVFEVIPDFFIPQGFSPNGDGVNDFFVIRGIKYYPNNEFQVLNRWGNLVYKEKGYNNTWDGRSAYGPKIGGDELPEGTYFYILDLGNGTKPYTGFIYLNRGLTK